MDGMPLAARRTRRASAAAALVAVTLLAGCSGGLSAHAGTPFTACLRDSGVDVSGMGSWTREEERDALTDARAMACVLSDLPEDERRDVLSWAFPDVPPDASADAREPVADAVAAYLASQDPADPAAIDAAGELLVALGMTDPEPAAVRHAIAFEPHRTAADPRYEAWREAEGLDDDAAARARFVQEQLEVGGALADLFSDTSEALRVAQKAAARG
jgi:hypothetical protein